MILSQSNAISDLLAGGGTVLTRAIEALDRVSRVLSDNNIKNLTGVISDIHGVTAELNSRKSVIADGKAAIRNLSEASKSIKDAAQSAQSLIGKLDGPAGDFATTGLPQLSAAIVTLQGAAESLDRLTNEIERDPRGIIAKAPAKQVEVKP